jgi:hypothetical protein
MQASIKGVYDCIKASQRRTPAQIQVAQFDVLTDEGQA